MKRLSIALLGIIVLLIGTSKIALANHHAVKVASKDGVGQYLTDAKGMTLYWFKKDTDSQSVCNGGCLEKWPIFYRENVAAQNGIDPKDFGNITRNDGKEQTTFRGLPLYYFYKDKNSGDTFGQGIKDIWYVIDPANFPHR